MDDKTVLSEWSQYGNLIPLVEDSDGDLKRPRDKGYLADAYTPPSVRELRTHINGGGAVGLNPRAGVMGIDYDVWDAEAQAHAKSLAEKGAVAVTSPSGKQHVWVRVNPDDDFPAVIKYGELIRHNRRQAGVPPSPDRGLVGGSSYPLPDVESLPFVAPDDLPAKEGHDASAGDLPFHIQALTKKERELTEGSPELAVQVLVKALEQPEADGLAREAKIRRLIETYVRTGEQEEYRDAAVKAWMVRFGVSEPVARSKIIAFEEREAEYAPPTLRDNELSVALKAESIAAERGLNPEAVLLGMLTVVSAQFPGTLVIPNPVLPDDVMPIALHSLLFGAPGLGKSKLGEALLTLANSKGIHPDWPSNRSNPLTRLVERGVGTSSGVYDSFLVKSDGEWVQSPEKNALLYEAEFQTVLELVSLPVSNTNNPDALLRELWDGKVRSKSYSKRVHGGGNRPHLNNLNVAMLFMGHSVDAGKFLAFGRGSPERFGFAHMSAQKLGEPDTYELTVSDEIKALWRKCKRVTCSKKVRKDHRLLFEKLRMLEEKDMITLSNQHLLANRLRSAAVIAYLCNDPPVIKWRHWQLASVIIDHRANSMSRLREDAKERRIQLNQQRGEDQAAVKSARQSMTLKEHVLKLGKRHPGLKPSQIRNKLPTKKKNSVTNSDVEAILQEASDA